jgi:endonuclease III
VGPETASIKHFQDIFCKYHITPEWVLQQQSTILEKIFRPIGRQKQIAKNLMNAATKTVKLGRIPRSYREMITEYSGIGPKISLIIVQEIYGDVVRESEKTMFHIKQIYCH